MAQHIIIIVADAAAAASAAQSNEWAQCDKCNCTPDNNN
jgi:hypothetical protein